MLNWLRRLGLGRVPGAEDARLDQAVERAIYQVEPRLKQAGGYPGRYRPSIARAWVHARDLASRIPGPIDLDRQHFIRDPFVHALFGAADDIRRVLCQSPAMQAYLGDPANAGDDVYALLSMRRNEKATFGMETDGALLRRDVAQQQVSFSDHALSCLAATEQAARDLIAWSLLDSLVSRVARLVDDLRQEKKALEQERDELLARLRGAAPERRAALQGQLDERLDRLRQAVRRLDLRAMAHHFDDEFTAPQEYVHLRASALRLDAMGVLRRPEETVASQPLTFTDLFGIDRRRLTVLLVRCPRAELPPLAERLAAADRWLAA